MQKYYRQYSKLNFGLVLATQLVYCNNYLFNSSVDGHVAYVKFLLNLLFIHI